MDDRSNRYNPLFSAFTYLYFYPAFGKVNILKVNIYQLRDPDTRIQQQQQYRQVAVTVTIGHVTGLSQLSNLFMSKKVLRTFDGAFGTGILAVGLSDRYSSLTTHEKNDFKVRTYP